jgi:hypothetical protein
MRIDLYTKAILTIIAACLVWLTFGARSILPVVEAQNPDRVVIVGWEDRTGFVTRLPELPESLRQRPFPVPVKEW